jgi:hypothetical protein
MVKSSHFSRTKIKNHNRSLPPSNRLCEWRHVILLLAFTTQIDTDKCILIRVFILVVGDLMARQCASLILWIPRLRTQDTLFRWRWSYVRGHSGDGTVWILRATIRSRLPMAKSYHCLSRGRNHFGFPKSDLTPLYSCSEMCLLHCVVHSIYDLLRAQVYIHCFIRKRWSVCMEVGMSISQSHREPSILLQKLSSRNT